MADDLLGQRARVAALLHGVRPRGERPARVVLDERLDELVERRGVGDVAAARGDQLERRQRVARRAAALAQHACERRRRRPRARRRRPPSGRARSSTSIGSRWNCRCWVRLRMVSLTFCGSVVASTNTTCGGGSSSVFSSAASAGLGEHVHLVEDVHLVPPGRAERGLLDQVAHRVDAVVARRVELVHVVAGAALDREARVALAARLAVDRVARS